MASIAGSVIFATNALAMVSLISIPFVSKHPSYEPDVYRQHKWLTRFFYFTVLVVAVSTIVFFTLNETTLGWIGTSFIIASLLLTVVWPSLRLYTYFGEETRFKQMFKTIERSARFVKPKAGGSRIGGPSKELLKRRQEKEGHGFLRLKEPPLLRRAQIMQMKQPTRIITSSPPHPPRLESFKRNFF